MRKLPKPRTKTSAITADPIVYVLRLTTAIISALIVYTKFAVITRLVVRSEFKMGGLQTGG